MDDERYTLTTEATERDLLTTFLEFQRNGLVRKCAGLSDAQLRSRAIPSSGVSLVVARWTMWVTSLTAAVHSMR